jgi:short-subunit dehydrogenase
MEFADRYGPWALVAGASEGVGASAARLLGQRGINVVLVSRREALLRDVAETVPSSTRRVVLDLSEPTAGDELQRATADLEIGLLVYNAGADPNMSRFLDKPLNVWQAMLTRNCATVMASAYHFGGLMARRGRGGLVLVTSGAAWAGGSHLAVYGATKAFNLILAESLWAEFESSGVDVLAMVLGQTDTPALRSLLGGREVDGLADPDDVARDMLDNLANGPTWPPDTSPLGSMPRRQAVELMTEGSASLFRPRPSSV